VGGLFGGRPQTQTSSSSTQPQLPAYLQPYMTDAAEAAKGFYKSGSLTPAYYPGSTVAPQSMQTRAGIMGTTARAMMGSPLLPAAQQQSLNTISGNYLYAGSNPYLQSAMNAANRGTVQQFGESVLPGLNASFARAGRSSSGAYGNTVGRVAEGLSRTLADNNARMAGNNYTAERGNQMTAIAGAPQLAQADYVDAEKLMGVGALQDEYNQNLTDADVSRYNYNANLNQLGLQNYIGLLNGTAGSVGNGGTSTSTQYGNQTRTQSTLMTLGRLAMLGM